MPTREEVLADIESKITDKTPSDKVQNTEDGANRVLIVDYIDQEVDTRSEKYFTIYKAKITQSGTDDPILTVLKNDTGLTFTLTRSTTGVYSFGFSELLLDLTKIDIIVNLQTGAFQCPIVNIDNLGVLATIETRYWNGSNFVLSDDILNNATIYFIKNN